MARYYEGPTNARIALIGEAPGQTEVAMNRPFVGKSGQLLDRLMHRVGILRQECYLDNVFQARPPGNDANAWLDLSKKYVVESDRYREAADSLAARLSAVDANVLVAVGNTPLYTLTGKKAVTKRRGSILPGIGPFAGRKVIPIIHPSAALRQYLYSQLIVMDLRRVVDQSFMPELKLLDRELLTLPSFNQCLAYIYEAAKSGSVAFDIEVMRQEVSHLSLAMNAKSAISIPFSVNGDNYFSPPQELQLWRTLAGLLEDPKVQKIGQNLSFDSTFLYRKFGIHVKPMDDTMIAQAIIFPDYPKGLDFIQSLYYAGEPYYKDDGKEWFRYAEGEEAFRRYSAMDSAVVAEAWPRMEADLRATQNWETYQRQKGILEPLVFIGERGIRMNVEGLKEAAIKSQEKIEQTEQELWKVAGEPINWRSPAQLKTYFYVTKGLPAYTKKGAVTTDDKALKRLSAKGEKEADLILTLRSESKLHGTYYTMDLDDDGRMRCSYNPVGTKQGRISSSKTIFGKGGNLQNQPPPMKAMMMADEGYLAIGHDLGQAENRVVAYDANESKMIEAFEAGVDIHKLTASLIYGIPIEQVTKKQRDEGGKRANHGLNYDLGYKSFAVYYQIPESESRFIVERYHQIYPGVRRWHAVIRDELQRTRTLTNLFGRRRVFMDRWGYDLWKEAYSYIPQSTVAEVVNQRGVRFVYERQDLFAPVELLNTVHDSLIYQVPLSAGIEYIAETILTVKANLERPLTARGREFSIPVDTKIGFTLGESEMLELKAKDATSKSMVANAIEGYLNARAA